MHPALLAAHRDMEIFQAVLPGGLFVSRPLSMRYTRNPFQSLDARHLVQERLHKIPELFATDFIGDQIQRVDGFQDEHLGRHGMRDCLHPIFGGLIELRLDIELFLAGDHMGNRQRKHNPRQTCQYRYQRAETGDIKRPAITCHLVAPIHLAIFLPSYPSNPTQLLSVNEALTINAYPEKCKELDLKGTFRQNAAAEYRLADCKSPINPPRNNNHPD